MAYSHVDNTINTVTSTTIIILGVQVRGVRAALATPSWVRSPPAAAVYQRQLSVPSLWGRLKITSESWGVNGHTTGCTGLVFAVLRLSG